MFAAIKANRALSSVGEISRPRQEAANVFLKLCTKAVRPAPQMRPSSLPSSRALHGLPKIQFAQDLQVPKNRSCVVTA